MKTENKGFWRGIVYPLAYLAIHGALAALLKSGWLTEAGSLALTGLVAYIDHTVLPNVNIKL